MAIPSSAMAAKTTILMAKKAWVMITEEEFAGRPGHGHHRLNGVFRFFAALGGFVPDTPFANLPEGKRREIPAALCAFRHIWKDLRAGPGSYFVGSTKTAVPYANTSVTPCMISVAS